MKRINKKTRAGIITSLSIFSILTVIGITTFLTKNANAETSVDPNSIAYKILLNEMKDCFAEPYMYTSISVGNTGNGQGDNQYISFEKSVLKNKKAAFEEDESGKKLLPTKTLTLDEKWKSVDCTGLFIGGDGDGSFGNDDFGGVLGISGKKIPTSASNNQEIGGFLKSFGYSNVSEIENVGNNAGETCHNLSYELKPFANGATTKTGEIVTLCWSNELLQNVSDGYALVQELDDGSTSIDAKSNGLLEFNSVLADPNGVYVLLNFKGKGTDYMDENNMPFDDIIASTDYIIKQNGKPTYSNSQGIGFRDSFYGILYKNYEQYGQISVMDNVTEKSTNSTATKQLKYKISPEREIHNGVYPTAYGVARNFLSGGSSRQEIPESEKLVLYKHYLDNVFNVEYELDQCLTNKPSSYSDGEGHFYTPIAGSGWCRTTWTTSDKKVAVFGGDNYELTKLVGIEELFSEIFNLDLDDEEIEKIIEGIEKKEYDDKVDAAANMDPCFSKANSLGWILCPVIEFLSDTTENLYSWIEDDFMVIEANFFARTESSSVYSVWSSFVGFANTLLVIFLMIIVFSQLTGIGIDNYGIKKTLPKIIIAAILINLSYIICELAVDLSNILGRGLNDWFTAMGQGVPLVNVEDLDGISQSAVGTHSGLFNVLKVAISGGVITSGVIAIVETVSGGGFVAILLPLLIALVVAVVAIFFFFVLLGLRKAGVIMLVAISPLAFICYTLPNTKPLFKKWLKALEGLLILYPICGLMIGGGYYVSRVILSISGDYFMRFVAFMLTVVPFFFIPKLLIGSFAAMGNIGAKISGISKSFGKRTSARLDKGIRNSERFKDTQERHAGERANRIAARLKKRSETGDLSARDQRRLVRYNKQANEWNAANDSGHLSAILAAQEQAVGEQRVKDEEALIRSGAGGINANSPESLESGYKAAIDALDANPADASMLAKVKAFQNVMSKTDKGRASMQKVLEQAVKDGKDSAAYSAASHLSSEHMGDIKNVNRGMFGMLNDIASGEGGDKLNLSGVRSNIGSKKYDIAGANKYTAKTLSSADEETLNRLANGISYMSNNERNSISQTANTALSNPNIVADLKPEVVENLRKLANSGVGGTSGRMGPHGSADMDESGF
ncbi:MAG: hypothetical protein MJZ22_02770 [Candidatus Saccharibacteria bacterium]|nr:hypothetical protein [Candidatus Saccharibacteria bacterium]